VKERFDISFRPRQDTVDQAEPSEPRGRELRAVKNGRVVAVTDEEVLRPGPYVAEGLRTLAHALHPAVVP
jgi:ABC-type Fe3+-hydroxamate transport system substrate-binding protein